MPGSPLRRLVLQCVVVATLGSCNCDRLPASGSRPYEPKSPKGKELMQQAQRNVWPSDVRRDLSKYSTTLVAWAGVVAERRVFPDGKAMGFVIEHHYWDWVEDFGLQREHVFLSPRGEGRFAITEVIEEHTNNPGYLPVGSMAIVFGVPMQLTNDGMVVLDYKWSITIVKPWFATDIWDYGRAYLEKHDQSDLKVLRTF